jgi:divalent metal cation (Fe/Co/Zn/Cd) transporter
MKAAYHLTVHSICDLLDVSLPSEEETWVKDKIKEMYPRCGGFITSAPAVRGYPLCGVSPDVEPTMSVQDSHAVNDKIVSEIKCRFKDSKVLVHIEPCDNSCESKCLSSCFVKHPPA